MTASICQRATTESPARAITRRTSEARDWWVAEGAPDPSLRAHALRYQGYYERTEGVAARRHPPTGAVPIIVGFEAPMRLPRASSPAGGGEMEPHLAFVAGPHDTFGLTVSEGVSHGFQVDLTPIGAYLFFGLPLTEIANRAVELDEIMGAAGREFVERLRVQTNAQGFDVIDDVIARRIASARPASRAVVWAWRQIEESGGRVGIGSLAEQVGWSRKHLITRFREHVGMTPKTYARIVRFARARRLLEQAGGEPRWADIAVRSGYYDQAHLIRDFVRFTGSTPTQYVALQLPGGGMQA